MLAFYVSMMRDVPQVFRGTAEAWMFWRGLTTVHSTWSGHPFRPLSDNHTKEQLHRDISVFDYAVGAMFTQPGMDSAWKQDSSGGSWQ
jgi:hypothetical protein